MTASTVTAEERGRFLGDGFVSLDRVVVPADELDAVEPMIRTQLSRSIDDGTYHDLGTGDRGAPVAHEVVDLTRKEPRLLRSAAFRRLERVAAQLLDAPKVRLHFDHAILKPAQVGAATAWHQDVAFDPRNDVPMATIWLAFTDVDASSSCMTYVPGSHRVGLIEHHRVGHHGLEASTAELPDAVDCPLPRGGLSAHGARTMHAAGANTSDHDRLAWVTKFVVDDRSALRRMAATAHRRVSPAAAKRY